MTLSRSLVAAVVGAGLLLGLAGCASTPAGLQPGAWNVVEIDGAAVTGQPPEFVLSQELDQVSGSTGVNRFSGPCTVEGSALFFGNLMTTRMAGPEAAMAQEQSFLAALGQIDGWRADSDTLELTHAGRRVLLLRRREP